MSGTDMNYGDDLRLDLDRLSDNELEALAQIVLKKLREAMQQESDRSGSR